MSYAVMLPSRQITHYLCAQGNTWKESLKKRTLNGHSDFGDTQTQRFHVLTGYHKIPAIRPVLRDGTAPDNKKELKH